MIDSLRGKLAYKSPTYIRVDVNGVGFGLNIPVSTYNCLGEIGGDISLFTYLHVREDIMRLYGFKTQEEIKTFKMLISVTLIGPQLALGILSSISSDEFKKAIIQDDFNRLDAIPGIGKKTAQRMVIELKEKISSVGEILDKTGRLNEAESSLIEEAVRALISLGCSKKEALLSIKTSYIAIKDKKPSLEELIKYSLRHL